VATERLLFDEMILAFKVAEKIFVLASLDCQPSKKVGEENSLLRTKIATN